MTPGVEGGFDGPRDGPGDFPAGSGDDGSGDRRTNDGGTDDVALLRAHVAGDPAAFGVLFTRHRDRLWAVALRTTGNTEDAADALQDALISAFRRAESFRGDSAVTTWLHRIVVNACLDRLRRAKVRSADALPDDLEEQVARGSVVAAGNQGSDPEAQALAGDLRHRLLAALEQIPPDQRAALVLVDMEGLSVQEAAAILDVPVGTIKSRCARGRARLAVLLADLGPRSEDAGHADPAGGGTAPAPRASHPGDPPTSPPGDAPPGRRPGHLTAGPADGHDNPREEVSGHE
ncbi:MAG: polymerase, sigma subunit, family [Marmoricola sp.]|nr:polymerase, sigma subunit, family [Marmoricola sp.]